MQIREQYQVEIKGTQPLLMHADDIKWADQMEKWKIDNKKLSKAGDDRTPAHRWLGSCYHDGENFIIPLENVMRCLMEAGAMVLVGIGKKTFKAQTQSGILPDQRGWPLYVNGDDKPLPWAPIAALMNEKDFDRHMETAQELGFELYLKRARIGAQKHIRVRPKFHSWSTTGTLTVIDEQLTERALNDIFTAAGTYKGLGDWRPGGRTPGAHGTFVAQVTRLN